MTCDECGYTVGHAEGCSMYSGFVTRPLKGFERFEQRAKEQAEREVTGIERAKAGDPDPLDFTASLGPIRVDPNADAARARVVREALIETCDTDLVNAGHYASDAVLAKLGRMLKN